MFELGGAPVTESRVEPASIVDLFDEVREVCRDVGEGLVLHEVYGLDLERLHKAFCFGVVVRIAAASHRSLETVLGQELAVILGRILGGFK